MTTETDSQTSTPGASPDSPATTSLPAAGESGSFSTDSNNPAEAAMARALASRESDSHEDDPSQTVDSETSDGQAPDPAKAGASSQEEANEDGATEADPNGSDPEQEEGDSRSPEPLAAPESWATDRKDEFGKLDPNSQKLVLDFYEDMNGGLNKAMQKLADARKETQSNFGVEATTVKELVDLGREFETDPVKVISQLAEQAGLPVFFSPQSDDQIPEFESTEQQTKWIRDTLSNQTKADVAADRNRADAERETNERIRTELAEALTAHPDLSEHRDAVLSLMAEKGVTATEAYRLSTWDKVSEMAMESKTLKADLEKLQAENEKLKKTSTKPPAKEIGDAQREQEEAKLSPHERALRRAQRALAQR
ncbi:hypothetical protein [Endozoicomonas sp. 2B-B]